MVLDRGFRNPFPHLSVALGKCELSIGQKPGFLDPRRRG